MRVCKLIPLLLVLVLSFSCKSAKYTGTTRRFPIEGRVVSVDASRHEVTLDHKEVQGYMKAMTMPFKVRDEWVLTAAHSGDQLQATLVVTDEAVLENVVLTASRGQADQSSTSSMHLPQPGEQVPDFTFINQEGRKINLAQFRGEPLLVTFIYSRCPLPDYCIRMSGNFAQIARSLKQSNPAAFNKLHMLSITIDPEYDNPKVLREYAKSYAGSVDPELKHWTFATGTEEQIHKAAEYFGMSYEKQSGQIIHDLRTAVIDADGKVSELYRGNEWKPNDVAQKIVSLQK